MKLDWDRGHGPVTGPINAAAATLTTTWAGHVTDMPWQAAALATGSGLLGTHIAGLRTGATRTTLAMRAAGWLGVGGWSSWALIHGPWSQWSITTLIAGAIGLGAAMTGARHAETRAEAQREETARRENAANLDAKRRTIATEWEQRIARVAHEPVQVVGVEFLDSDAGYIIDGETGPGGGNWKTLKRTEDALAADAKLPEGCGVEIGPGAHRGAFIATVSTVNKLIDNIDYPADYSPLTCNQPAPIGVRRDGTHYGPVNRQASMFFVGQRGSGKTNLMNVGVANNCRMPDSLTWVIDLNGGGLALKWMRAWHAADRPGRPPIDWVADTPEKAIDMAAALVRIAKARKVGYQQREIDADDDKLPVDHEVPEIRVFNDEGAEIFSTRNRRDELLRQISDDLIQTLEIARAAAVNETTSGLRGTQDVISDPQILKQSTFKVGMKVADDSELNYFFGYGHNASTEDAPYPGCALVRDGSGPVMPIKVYRLKPSQIADIVKATAHLRPELDELSRKAAGEAYENRWNNTGHLFGTAPAPVPAQTTTEPTTAAPAADTGPTPRRATGVTADWGTTPAPPSIKNDLDRADEAVRHLHNAMDEASNRDPDLDQEFQALLEAGGMTWKPPAALTQQPAAEEERDPRYPLVYAIVQDSGPAGIGPAAIQEFFARLHPDQKAPNTTVIGRWLKADPRIHQPKYGSYAIRPNPAGE